MFSDERGVSAKRNVNNTAFLYHLFDVLFYTGRTITFLKVSTMLRVQEYLPIYAVNAILRSFLVFHLAQKNFFYIAIKRE